MIKSETNVKIIIDREDRTRICNAINLLEEIENAFNKSGGFVENEKNLLKAAAHILDEILRYETF